MPATAVFRFVVPSGDIGTRLDLLVASRVSVLTRSQAAVLIQQGNITVNGVAKKTGYRLQADDEVAGRIPPPGAPAVKAEPLALTILHEDPDLIVVNKPPGQVVHPAPGHLTGTLVNALLHHCPSIGPIGGELRPGIVHRLDKDTSGILVVAKNAGAQAHLAAQFAARTVCKVYLAVVLGNVTPESGVISLPVGRHPVDRKRMATTGRRLRAAETRWKVRERFDGLTLVELNLKTGRTHQARVHCAAIHHAIVGDPVYGGRKAFKSIAEDPRALIRRVKRQMLHARQLTFVHPRRLVPVSFEAPLADDMAQLISRLRRLSTPSA